MIGAPVRVRALGLVLALAAALAATACTTTPPVPGAEGGAEGSGARRVYGTPPPPNPAVKRAMISRAEREWEFFGRQTVVYRGASESIPNVGIWEDDDSRASGRVNLYWRAVGKSQIDGADCRQPWSAAFISWVMQGAGVPPTQFPPAQAHWMYLAELIEAAPFGGRWFVPRRIGDYSPQAGDLICASRDHSYPRLVNGYATTGGVQGVKAHCDLVVAKSGRTLEAIGGNVRNSVSRSSLELDAQGHLQPVPRRPWFVVLQNRL